MSWQFAHRCCLLFLLTGAALFGACGNDNPSETADYEGVDAQLWMDEILLRIEEDALSPPKASRILAYTGIAIYESTVEGMPDHRSLGGQLNGLDPIPPAEQDIDHPSVLHATLGHLTPVLFEEEESREQLARFAEINLIARSHRGVAETTLEHSINRGAELAELIARWSFDDGYFVRNNRQFEAPDTDYAWVPTGDFEDPLEPHWDTLRPFAIDGPRQCPAPDPVPFSTEPDSDFYAQAMAVWEASQQLDDEQETIAQYWADDPGESSTPPGHWMAIAGQIIVDRNLNLEEAAEVYALLGIATGDAVITCWEQKYRSYLLRPVTYIRDHIDSDWETLIETPPFPEYTSGHSTFSGAAADILTHALGDIAFEDRTHVERGFEPRQFDSFRDAADEAARSRLYGGIHYPMGNDEGLLQGECVADRVLENVDLRR